MFLIVGLLLILQLIMYGIGIAVARTSFFNRREEYREFYRIKKGRYPSERRMILSAQGLSDFSYYTWKLGDRSFVLRVAVFQVLSLVFVAAMFFASFLTISWLSQAQ